MITSRLKPPLKGARCLAISVFLVDVALLSAQDPAPKAVDLAVPEEISAALSRLRSGTWDSGDTSAALKHFLANGLFEAAGWWLSSAEDALKSGRLPASARKVVAEFRSEWKKNAGPDPSHLRLAEETTKLLDVVVRARNFEQGRRLIDTASQFSAEFPDSRRRQIVEKCRKDLDAHRGEQDLGVKLLEEHKRACDALLSEASPLVAARVKRGLAEYAVAGCAAGRLELRQRILAAFGGPFDPLAQKHLRELYSAARDLEPTLRLELFLCGEAGQAALYREEGPSYLPGTSSSALLTSELHPRLLKVFPGDVIRLVPIGGAAEEKPKLQDGGFFQNSVFAVQARLEDKDLPRECWSCIPKSELEESEMKRQPVLFGQKVSWPANLKPLPGRNRTEFALEWEFPAGTGKKSYTAFEKILEHIEAQFQKRDVPFHWVMGSARSSVVVLSIP
jgi:hypothetical protein